MAMQLDHVILPVNDRARSIEFYTRILGFAYEGEREPFSVIRVNAELSVGNMRGPGDEAGSRGPGKAVYVFDPSKHLIEVRHYEL